MARYDDLNTRSIAYLTILSVPLLAVTILLLQALCYNWIDWQEDGKLIKQSYGSSDAIIAKQKSEIKAYARVQEEIPVEQPPKQNGAAQPNTQAGAVQDGASKSDGTEMKKVDRIHIPIEKAEELLMEELKASSGKVELPST